MRNPVPGVEPVAIALDQIEAGADVRFSGIDLETGARVTVSVERRGIATIQPVPTKSQSAHGLVLVLTVETISSHQ